MKIASMPSFLVLALLLGLVACAPHAPPELQRGVQMIRWMAAPMQLSKSMYSAIQDGKASTWVGFVFSSMGAAEWPESDESAERDPMILEQAKSANMPLAPKGVTFAPGAPNPSKGRQIVLKADDARGMIIVEAYDNPSAKPLLTEEIPLPKVQPAPGVTDMWRDSADLGVDMKKRR